MGIISEIILFTSQSSAPSRVCVNLVKEYDLPIKIVRIDTEEARKKAKYNKKISITKVPTLAVVFDDDDIKIYIGSEKICKWIRNFREQEEKRTQPPSSFEGDDTPTGGAFGTGTSSGSGTSSGGGNVKVFDTNSDGEDEGNGGIEELNVPVETYNPLVSNNGGSSNGSSSKMQSLLEKAKEMEEAAKKAFGGDAFSRRNDY
jgi:hypothetical protein